MRVGGPEIMTEDTNVKCQDFTPPSYSGAGLLAVDGAGDRIVLQLHPFGETS
jgi:hypothetical protein